MGVRVARDPGTEGGRGLLNCAGVGCRGLALPSHSCCGRPALSVRLESVPATQLPARPPAPFRGADGCAQRQHLDALLHPGDS